MARETPISLAILAPVCLIAITLTAFPFTHSAASAEAATWYVDASVAASGDGHSPETPFKTIQEGIDAASDGDTVTVAEGVYVELVQFKGKNIALTSTNPLDPLVVAGTVIDAGQAGVVVTFAGTEKATCVLSGFTIRNGASPDGGGICGGTWDYRTYATIRHNVIIENHGESGGGIRLCNGTIEDNIISNNSATYNGGGVDLCKSTFQNNRVFGNSAGQDGGGLSHLDGSIRGNAICHNSAIGMGAGLYGCNGTIENNLIWGNSTTGIGGGLARCGTAIQNNTIYGNLAGSVGGGLFECSFTIRNCIIWGNRSVRTTQLEDSSVPTYSCIENWAAGGEGNVRFNPHFVDVENGDFHLKSWSPCIDAGDPSSAFSNEPEPNGNRVDMGAYGNTPEATRKSPDADSDDLPDDWEMHWFAELGSDGSSDPDGDVIPNALEYRYGWDPLEAAATRVHNQTRDTWYETIQAALLESSEADELVVHPGVYLENLRFPGWNVVLRSATGAEAGNATGTVIDGNGKGPVVAFAGTENETCVLSGFTLRNGNAFAGGAISGGGTHAVIQNNVVVGNSGPEGVVRECNGVLQNNTIYGNWTRDYSGVVFFCHGIIRNLIIWGNEGGKSFYSSEFPSYCCLENWTEGGEGNISDHPHFVNAPAGDFHLRSWSPCIDAGDPSSPYSIEPEPNGGCIDMGAYGNTPQSTSKSGDSDSDQLPDDWEMEFFGSLAQGADGDPDGDSVSNGREHQWGLNPTTEQPRWYVDGSVTSSGDGTSWEKAFKAIQEGINAARHGDTIIVAEGTYVQVVQFGGKNVRLSSMDPLNPSIVANTVFDSNRTAPVVAFSGFETENCALAGFTIRNGFAEYGGGICGGTEDNHTDAMIQNNVITGNSAKYGGGGMAFCDGVVENNTITGNSATEEYGRGGGLYRCDGFIQDNIITHNTAAGANGIGGGLANCGGTVQKNVVSQNTAGWGGGAVGYSDATIQNNTISANSALASFGGGGGLIACSGLVENNVITGNWTNGAGGGLDGASGTVRNNFISQNSCRGGAALGGGGLCGCDGTVEYNTIIGNSAEGEFGNGGGIAYCEEGTIRNNVISGNSADGSGGGIHWCRNAIWNNVIVGNTAARKGGGLNDCTGPVESNTIADNSAGEDGGGLFLCTGAIHNCIIWGNKGGSQLSSCSPPSYCSIEGWSGTLGGNVSFYPYFVDALKGDYHLKTYSPCMDAGDPTSPFSQEPEPNGGRIDMGAYGNTPEATSKSPDTDGDGLPDDWEIRFLKNLAQGAADDPDKDLISNIEEYCLGSSPTVPGTKVGFWYVDGAAPVSGDGTSWAKAFKTIRQGVSVAGEGHSVIVAEGVYRETLQLTGRNIILTSRSPNSARVIARTVIDGNQAGSVITFAGTENAMCLLAGFTIRNGKGSEGGGINGGRWESQTHATIQNNVITGNTASYGGGLAYCGGVIEGNRISGNFAAGEYASGGGLYGCHGIIESNAISGNSNGGLRGCNGTIRNNLVSENTGGGIADCSALIEKNWIRGNSGPGMKHVGGAVRNNIISGNLATGSGAGLVNCEAVIENNTIFGNVADVSGGGVYQCKGTMRNCIIWENRAPREAQVQDSGVPSYSCIQDWMGGGEGNIAFVPYFVDAANGDFRLRPWSPCIDAGDPTSPFADEPQPNGSRVDMGAYGNTPEATCKSLDVDSDGLPDDWEMLWFKNLQEEAIGDPDGDGILNVVDYHYAWNPTSPAQTRVSNETTGVWYQTIQSALVEAVAGDQLVAQPGTYLESVWFGGKNVVLQSTAPLDSSVVSRTIIDPGQTLAAVRFSGAENETCILSGFTLRNGRAVAGGGISGGTENTHTHATIQHNAIVANSATLGGGMAYCDGIVENNVIVGNLTSSYGGGLYECDGVLQNNTIAGNNRGGLRSCQGTILNCIVWGNRGGSQLSGCSIPAYSCIEGWTGGGEGNISYYPHFLNVGIWDCHLVSWSPCIDAGDPASPFVNEPLPTGGRIDMGAYGNMPEATSKSSDTDGDNLPDDWEVHFFASLAEEQNGDADNDQRTNDQEYHRGWNPAAPPTTWHVDGSVAASGDGARWDTAFKTIQEGVNAAAEGDYVVVAEGTYVENVRFPGRSITLTCKDPLDAATVASTVIDGNKLGSVVAFEGPEDEFCVLTGFTIRNGGAETGGGVCGGIPGNFSRASIRNNVITANSAQGGGGLAYCGGVIENNTINNNSATGSSGSGGGLAYCPGSVRDNVISGNSATGYGGGLYQCDGTVERNTVVGNSATRGGGGLSGCDGEVQNNVIAGNSANEEGGGLHNCNTTVQRNLIYNNSTQRYGGGLSSCGATIQNNTIFGNSAGSSGGGFRQCRGTIVNCIIWGNTAPSAGQLNPQDTSLPTYSCIEGMADVARYNISADPRFVSPAKNDYHLQAVSPCIDAGSENVAVLPSPDIDGEAAPFGSSIDMGADEYVDSDHDSLADYWEIERLGTLESGPADDPDGDLLTNSEELLASTDPANSDTDYDGLTDYEELKTYHLDPSDGDCDDDNLKDGEEVNTWGTNPANPDSDDDRIPDGWEAEYGLDPLKPDATNDPDGDGLSNVQEYQNSTDPRDADSDDDGLNDMREVFLYGTDPLNPDTDGDSKDDSFEVLAGTDPRDARSLFEVIAVSWGDTGVRVEWSVVSGRTYQVYVTEDLRAWSAIGKLRRAGASDKSLYLVDAGSGTAGRSSYRVEVRP